MKNISLADLDLALSARNFVQAKEIQSQMCDEFVKCVLDSAVFHTFSKFVFKKLILLLCTLDYHCNGS